MPSKKYLLFSLDDEKAKKLGEVISNSTSRKIMNFLAENEASEKEIASELKIPLNTIDYNVKRLIESGLIEEIRHLWSVKGKRIPVYRVSNKQIIISPKRKSNLNKLKSIVPVVLVAGAFSFFVKWYEKSFFALQKTAETFSRDKVISGVEQEMVSRTGDAAIEATESIGQVTGNFISNFGILNWFLVGVWVLILIFVVWNLWRE